MACGKIAYAMFILKAAIIVYISPPVDARLKYNRAYFDGLRYLSRKVRLKAFPNRVDSHFQEKVGSIGILSGENMVYVVVAGLNKASVSMHFYLSVSHSPHFSQE